MSKREPGYYWVHIKDNFHDEWTIGEYCASDYWCLIDSDQPFADSYFAEIGEKIERK